MSCLQQAKDASTLESYNETWMRCKRSSPSRTRPTSASSQPKWPTVLQANIEGFAFNPINLGTYDFWTLSRKA